MKQNTTKGSWTAFWRSVGVNLSNEERWTAEEIYRNDLKRVKRLGVNPTDFEKVKKKFQKFTAPHLQVHRCVFLFAKDPETVQRWTGSKDITHAFVSLFTKIKSNTRDHAKTELIKLLRLYDLFKTKREIAHYTGGKITKAELDKLASKDFTHILRQGKKNSSFKGVSKFTFNKFTVFCIAKRTGSGNPVYKFIMIRRSGSKTFIDLGVDNSEEKERVLNYLSRKYKIPIERLKEKPDLRKFISFLKTGESGKFMLIGADLIDNGFRVNIYPQFNQPKNITGNDTYKKKVDKGNPLSALQKVRIIYTNGINQVPAGLNFFNYQNENIIGGVKFGLDARGLNFSKREFLSQDFLTEFGFHLDISLAIDIDEIEIYKKFLFNPPKRQRSIEIISDKTVEIAHNLLKHKLLPKSDSKEEMAKKCTYHGCPKKFRPQWTQNLVCTCGHELLKGGYVIVQQEIDEEKVRDFIYKMSKDAGYEATKLNCKLVRREIYILQVRKEDNYFYLIPITKPLNDQQLEILKYRYPFAFFITSRDDKEHLIQAGFLTEQLYSLVFGLLSDPKKVIEEKLSEISAQKSSIIDSLAQNSLRRISNDSWYVSQSNLGPEFFEADVYILLNYIFRNSVWLGASRRGEPLPDAISAFPLETVNKGCFSIDAKFSVRSFPDIGSSEKNKKYLDSGSNNKSIKEYGGLKGFAFVSNKPAPSNYTSIMTRAIGRRYIFSAYFTVVQLKLIFEHLKKWEDEMNRDLRKRNIFINSLELIFLKPKSYRKEDKIVVNKDSEIQDLLKVSEDEYKKLGSTTINIPKGS